MFYVNYEQFLPHVPRWFYAWFLSLILDFFNCQTAEMEPYVKIVNRLKFLSILATGSTLNIWGDQKSISL